jgi:hypothetical protein
MMEEAIRKALANGTGIRKVAAALSVGVGTVQRVKQACAISNAFYPGTCSPRPRAGHDGSENKMFGAK